MIVPLWIILVGYILSFCGLYIVPSAWKVRDDKFYQPPLRTPNELSSLGVCAHKKVRIQHSAETVERLEHLHKNEPVVGSVELSYITTKCDNVNDDGNPNTSTSTSAASPPRPKKEHILLVHGTGMSSAGFTDRFPQQIMSADSTITTENLSLWDLLRQYENKDKYDLTAVDIRGHGLSEITNGPYSVELLAADVAALMRSDFGRSSPPPKVHCHGLSVGFGICMAMSVYDADIVQTLSGSGFLFDRTNADLAPYIFSRELVVRLLGMSLMAQAGEIIMKTSSRGILKRWMSQTHIEGYIHVAAGWLNFDLTSYLADFRIPTLFLHPEYDEDIGHTRKLTEGEINRMPNGTAKLIEFPGHSHIMLSENNGARKVAKAVSSFIDEHSLLTVAS